MRILDEWVIIMKNASVSKFLLIMLLVCSAILAAAAADAETIMHEELKNNVVQAEYWTDENGNPVPGPYGYSRVEYTYKNQKLPQIIRYLDENGNLYLTDNGYAKVVYEYGNKNMVASVSYFGTDNEPCMCNEGYARVTYKYTMRGDIKTCYYFDTKEHKVIVPSLGYAYVINEYQGINLLRETRYDDEKNPVDGHDGYAVLENTMNRQYHVLESRYLHADGSAASGPDGWHHAVYENDAKGRHLSAVYYSENGEPCMDAEGVYEYGFEYDNEGRLTTLRLMSDGLSVTGRNGWSTCSYEYDDLGRKICTRYYDKDGKLTDRHSDYAYCLVKWNDYENCYMQTWYDTAEQPVDRGGYVTLVSCLSPFGRICENRYLDVAGQPVPNIHGVYIVRYDYDEFGRITGNRYYDEQGFKTCSGEGYASFRDILDEDGFVTSRIFYDAEDQEIQTLTYVYDDTMGLIGTGEN